MYVQSLEETKDKSVFVKIVATYPNGGTLCTSDLVSRKVKGGAVVGKGADGLFHVVKTAKLAAALAASTTTFSVAKGHGFAVGDKVGKGTAAGVEISTIADNATDPTLDDITTATALGASAIGTTIFETATTGSSPKYAPVGVLNSDADGSRGDTEVTIVVMGTACEENVAPMAGDLKGIILV